MPIPVLRARVAVVGLALATTMSMASVAEAKTIPAELRVVDSDGTVLAEQTQYTSKEGVEVRTDRKADCFGDGTGGSGQKVDVPGGSALAQLVDGGRADRDLRPLSVSDNFDFGLALCGIGEAVSPQTGYFYLKTNHVASQTGGDLTEVGRGDEVLWYLIEDFNDPIPDELELTAPIHRQVGRGRVREGRLLRRRRDEVPGRGRDGDRCRRADRRRREDDGLAAADVLELTATREGSIPSNEEAVCTTKPAQCPAGYTATIAGTGGDDKVATGRDAETVLAGGGDDRISAQRRGRPRPRQVRRRRRHGDRLRQVRRLQVRRLREGPLGR